MRLASPFTLCVLTLAAATWQSVNGHTNLLVNPSFEENTRKNWRSNGFTMEMWTADVVDGAYSVKCTGRSRDLEGPFQRNIPFRTGRHYGFEGYIKLLNDIPGKPWQTVKAAVQMTVKGYGTKAYNIAFRSFCDSSQGWIRLKGDIEAPQKEISDLKIMVRGPDPGVDFLVDNLTLYEIEPNPNWRTHADINIETHRKSNVALNVNLPNGLPPTDINVEVTLKKHLFPFGSMLRDDLVRETPTNDFMKLAYYFFNSVSIQSYKWKFNKGIPPDTNPDFSNAINATDILRAHGMTVRGHSIFWNVEKNVPDWVKAVPAQELLSVLHNHVDLMINLARGKLTQWDVTNEHIAGHYFEEKLNDKSVTKQMFVHARAMGDTAKLYHNEFQCITSGSQTEQYYDLAMEYIREGIPLDGLGIQGHTKDYVRPTPAAMWRRIDRLAETGLELMMTEFDLGWPNKVERADWFEDAIRAFFGHPAMHGVILWDFWEDIMSSPDHGLVEGPNLDILESGQRWACLVKKEWTTKETFDLHTGTNFNFRGFQGDYEVVVKLDGRPVQRELFTVGKQDANWDLTVNGNTAEIDVPVEFDYVPQCISHREERSLGTGSSSSPEASLSCRTVMSRRSRKRENAQTSVSCADDEVMTGCSSFQVRKNWTRNGETIRVHPLTGKASCVAYNGRNILDSRVKAYARCCKVAGLTCNYRTAGPSFPFDGAMAEARCETGTVVTGCSTYSAFPDSDGVRPNSALTSCVAQSGAPASTDPAEKSGAVAFAACCQTPAGMACQRVESEPTNHVQGKQKFVECPAGSIMTGCNAYAESGKSAGAKLVRIDGVEKCKAYIGANFPRGTIGVKAYATCCSIN